MKMRNTLKIFTVMLAALILFGSWDIVLPEEAEKLKLGIEQVTELALSNNFDIQIYKLDRRISEKDLLKAESVYDAVLDAGYKYSKDKLDRSSDILGRKAVVVSQSGSVEKKLPTGTMLSLGADHTRQASDSFFSDINPYHETGIDISVTQPLAKNALGIIDRNTVKITGLDVQSAGYTSLNKIEIELAGTQKSYWALVLAHRYLRLAKDMLENTEQLYMSNKRKFDIGMVELPELYAVEADLKQRKNDLLLAENNLHNALNMLRYKLNLNQGQEIIPADDFVLYEITSNFQDIISAALENRRDYKAAKNDVKAQRMGVEIKKNSLWPQIDLKATLRRNGLDQKFRDSIKEITSKDQPQYTVEVIFSFPFENSKARAEYLQKELEQVKALVNLKKTECLIFVEVNDAFINAKRMYDSAGLLRLAAELEHKKYLGEEERFNKGRSDTDRLLRYQNDYLRAEIAYLKSLNAYKEAVIDLNVAMNNLVKPEEKAL
jgi:outer membrane protein TolC